MREKHGTLFVAGVDNGMSVSVQLHEITGANDAEEAFIRESVRLLREAVSMPGFGASVRKADYGDTQWKGAHGSVRRLSGEEIWQRVQIGQEAGVTGDHTLNLSIAIEELPGPDSDRDGPPVIGATELGTLPIRTARWFLSQCVIAGDHVNMAAHLMHQWMHVSGFVHGADGHDSRDAPAVLGRLVRRALEWNYGDRIDAEITAMLIGGHTGCSCKLPAEKTQTAIA